MTDKCQNKKLFFLENPNTIKAMPNEILLQAYQYAKQNNMKKDFISLFESELQERGLLQ